MPITITITDVENTDPKYLRDLANFLYGGVIVRTAAPALPGNVCTSREPDAPAPQLPVANDNPAAGAIPLPPDAGSTAAVETPPSAPTTAGPVPMPPTADPSANTVPQPPSAPAAATTDPYAPVDSAGLPWDERIHAGSRATIADGTWRKRKNVAPEVFEMVMGELSSGRRAPPPTPQNIPMPPGAERGPRHMGVAADMPALNLKIVEAGLTIDDIRPALAAIGAPDMAFMSKVPALIPKLSAEIDRLIDARQGG